MIQYNIIRDISDISFDRIDLFIDSQFELWQWQKPATNNQVLDEEKNTTYYIIIYITVA